MAGPPQAAHPGGWQLEGSPPEEEGRSRPTQPPALGAGSWVGKDAAVGSCLPFLITDFSSRAGSE
eukprot:1191341-Heterocapsa_arctica.AAC.1